MTLYLEIKVGQLVTLNSALGVIERVVVSLHDKSVSVCRPAELESAKREGRKPVSVGFPFCDVIEVR